MTIILTAKMFNRTETTEHATIAEARERVVAIATAQQCHIDADDELTGRFIPQTTTHGTEGSYEITTTAPPADRIPTHRVADCRYCNRYQRACGRHEQTARERLTARIEAQTTDQLLAVLAELDRKAKKTEEERLVAAAVSDVITTREGIDAELDAIFADVEYDGTYYEAILIALARKAARPILAARRLTQSIPATPAAPVDEAYWQQAEADDLEARAAGPLFAVWTPEDYAQTVRDARQHRAHPSNVVEL
jgi:hypothetical protein